MSIPTIPIRQRAALRSRQFWRNGTFPSAYAQAYLQEEANHALWVRSKQVGRWRSPIQSVPAADDVGVTPAVEYPRWRFAYHAGTHATKLYVVMEVMRSGVDGSGADLADSPIAKLLVELVDGTDVGTAEFHPGFFDIDPDDIQAPNLWFTATLPLRDSNGDIVELTPDTDYFCTFTDLATRLISATVYETSLAADTDNGYLPDGPVAGSPVLDEDRESLVTTLRQAWKRNGATLWHWASNTDATAPSRTSGTRANVFDQTITTESSSSPGVTLMMAHKSTVRRASLGVPVVWKIFAQRSAAGGGNPIVYLMDGSDNVIDSIGITSTTAQWYAGTSPLYLAANDTTKYSLAFQGNGTQGVTLYASSLYQHET